MSSITRAAAACRTASTRAGSRTGSRSGSSTTRSTTDDRAFIEARDMFFLATADADGCAAVLVQGRRPGLRPRARRADDRVPELRRQRHVPLARERCREPARRPALHRLRRAEAAAAERHRLDRPGRPAARRVPARAVHRPRARRPRSSRTARATSTSCSSSSARASRRARTASRRCRTGSGASGPATCSPPAIRRTRVLARELELPRHAVVLGRARLEALERLVPGGARLGVVPLAAVERAEVRQHAAGAMAVAELRSGARPPSRRSRARRPRRRSAPG